MDRTTDDTTFTPGPWWTEPSAMTCTHVVYAEGRKLLCYLNYTGNDPQQAESAANARLMAAAPQLAEAARIALSYFLQPNGDGATELEAINALFYALGAAGVRA